MDKCCQSLDPKLDFLFLFIFCLVSNFTYGQSTQSDSLVYKATGRGRNPMSSYSGQSGYSIPLYDIQTKGFSIPVTIVYNSSGFKPNSTSGMVGLNWELLAGGSITRKVNQEPDDVDGICNNQSRGYYIATKNWTSNIDDQVFNFTASSVGNCNTYPGFEYSPDEFSFDCLGHSGKFYVTYGGNARVVSDEDIKVDLSNFAVQNYASLVPVPSTIVLTTSDGFKFTFGGAINSLDYTFRMPNKNEVQPGCVISKWHLVKATSPNGNEISYVYQPFASTISTYSLGSGYDNFYTLSTYFNSTGLYRDKFDYDTQQHLIFNEADHNKDAFRLSKTSYLQSIASDDFSLRFSYSQQVYKFYSNSSHVPDAGPFNSYGYKLDNITLYEKYPAQIKKFDFVYQDLGGVNGTRNFLTSLTESGKGTYTFNYYRTTEIPNVHVRSIDHWGFWNGGNDETSVMIPAVSQDTNGDQIISSTLRDPNGSYCNVAMLKSVIYPTGGKTEFVYEPHDYSRRLERRALGSFLPSTFTVAGIAGGTRIKSIRDSASTNSVFTKTYFYKTNYITGGTSSSGFLMEWPRYIFGIELNEVDGYTIMKKTNGSSLYLNFNTDEPFINYAEVTEELSGTGYKVLKFNNYDSNPDYSNSNRTFANGNPIPDNVDLYFNLVGQKVNDRSQERGKIYFDGYYDTNKVLLKRQSTTYPAFNSGTNDYVVSINPGVGVQQSYKIYTSPYRPISVTNLTIPATSPSLIETRSFAYDSNLHNLRSESVSKSNAKTVVRICTYPNDYAAGTTFIDNMKTAGMTGLPIEEVNYETDGTNQKIISGQVIQYYTGGKARPEIAYKLLSNAPIPLASFKFSSRTIGVLPINTGTPASFSIDSRYQPSINYRQYDSYGNPTEVIPTFYWKGVPTSYKYAYNGQFPIAEIKNSKLNDVYFFNFEDLEGPEEFDSNLNFTLAKKHTGNISGVIVNSLGSGEVSSHNHTYININSGAARIFTYSGWIYSTGPVAEILLFMYKAGETNYFTYVDNVLTNQIGKWVYVTKNVLVPADVVKVRLRLDCNSNGTVYFDDLAIRPAEAQIKTFTYQPFVGKTSEIEGNGRTTYYEYDQFQRLKNLKDQNGNIKKNYQYNFKL